MKPSEEWAKAQLSDYLTRRGLQFSCKEGENPPDLVFSVEGEKHAVEVTELHQYVDSGGEKSTITVEHRLFHLVNKIDRETSKRNRGYIVFLKGPLTEDQEREILAKAKQHILASKAELFSIGEKKECEVTPNSGKDTALAWIIFVDGTAKNPDSDVMLADIQGSIDYALGRILKEKVPRLKQFASWEKRVLVIVSEYFFADDENVRVGLQKRSAEIAPIDEVYLAWDSSFEIVHP